MQVTDPADITRSLNACEKICQRHKFENQMLIISLTLLFTLVTFIKGLMFGTGMGNFIAICSFSTMACTVLRLRHEVHWMRFQAKEQTPAAWRCAEEKTESPVPGTAGPADS